MLRKEMSPPEEKLAVERRALPGEDEEWVNKANTGEYIPPDIMFELNRLRLQKRKPFIIPKVKFYQDEKNALRAHAQESFDFRQTLNDRILQEISSNETSSDKKLTKQDLCDVFNLSLGSVHDDAGRDAQNDLGIWIADYLQDNGYHPHVTSVLIKKMILSDFPSITTEKEYTPDNLERSLLMHQRVAQEYSSALRRRRPNRLSLDRSFANGHASAFYS